MTKNVYQRLVEIKKEIDYIKKDKKVESYMAGTHDAVTAVTRSLFIKHGVMVVPDEKTSATVTTSMTTQKGAVYVRFEATFNVRFINVDDPTDCFSMAVTAHALDHGDKAPGKALSYATKNAILKALQLETGEGDESRATSEIKFVDLEYWRNALAQAESPEAKVAIWKLFSRTCQEAGDIDAHNALKEEMQAAKATA